MAATCIPKYYIVGRGTDAVYVYIGKIKCSRYWPTHQYNPAEDVGQMEFDGFVVFVLAGKRCTGYTLSELLVQRGDEVMYTSKRAHLIATKISSCFPDSACLSLLVYWLARPWCPRGKWLAR